MNWDSIRIWIAILLLLDAAFGLWNYERIEAAVPRIKVVKVAMIEGVVALILVLVPFLF
jgi:uncharacterized membrane protein YidH (DUF202 family)